MPFAIWYNREDLTPIAAEFTRQDLSPQDRSFANSVWGAGGTTWNTAPIETDPFRTGGDLDCRRLVISGKHQGQSITLQQFRDFLYRQAASQPGADYLKNLADDMVNGGSGAQEPWPIA